MATHRPGSAEPPGWNPASFQEVLAALVHPELPYEALTRAIQQSGGLPCPAPAWDASGTYRVHLDPDASPQIQHERGLTWWGVMSFRPASGAVPAQPHFTAQVAGHEGSAEASGKIIGPGGALVLVRTTGATPQEARRTATHAADSAVAKLNQGAGLGEWLAAIRAQQDVGADGQDPGDEPVPALAGVPDGGVHGRYLQARRDLQGALGLAQTD